MRRRVWKLYENNMRRGFEEIVGELVNVGNRIYGNVLRRVCYKHVKKCVERRKAEGTRGGGMRR